mmetsp:Transcript_75174/g.132875  ORF Transcript_75174/g.132875 Transcript_75174/m.132875 type:complete len:101 (+) Transcript_75174:440-742(+)
MPYVFVQLQTEHGRLSGVDASVPPPSGWLEWVAVDARLPPPPNCCRGGNIISGVTVGVLLGTEAEVGGGGREESQAPAIYTTARSYILSRVVCMECTCSS